MSSPSEIVDSSLADLMPLSDFVGEIVRLDTSEPLLLDDGESRLLPIILLRLTSQSLILQGMLIVRIICSSGNGKHLHKREWTCTNGQI